MMGKIKRRILVIDDEPDWIDYFRKSLKDTDIDVTGNTNMNSQEIKDILRNFYIHIAFVDIKHAEKDHPLGFELLRTIQKHSPCTFRVILTKYQKQYMDKILQALQYPSMASFVYSKELKGETVINKDIQKMFIEHIKINFNIELELENSYFNFKIDDYKLNYEEIYNLIGMLFSGNSDIKRLRLIPITEGRSNTNVFQVIPYVIDEVSLQSESTGRPVNSGVLKIGPRDEILKESENFDRYVQWYLKDRQRVHKLRYKESSNRLAGILYTFAGGKTREIISFSSFFKDASQDITKINNIISSLFDPKSQDWYSHKKSEDESIFSYYNKNLKLNGDIASMLDEFLRSRRPKDIQLKFREENNYLYFGRDGKVFNPVKYASENLFLGNTYHSCIVHGDLNGENILLNEKLEWILIDYAKVSRGHVFRDFISFEVHIRARMLSAVKNLEEISSIENALFETAKDCPAVTNQELARAFHIIKNIREKAKENFPEEPFKNYYIGLLYSCLHTFRHNLNAFNKQHILILAGITCDVLDRD